MRKGKSRFECRGACKRTLGGGGLASGHGGIARRVPLTTHGVCDGLGCRGDLVEGAMTVVGRLADWVVATIAVRGTLAYIPLADAFLPVLRVVVDLGSAALLGVGSTPERHSSARMGGCKGRGLE